MPNKILESFKLANKAKSFQLYPEHAYFQPEQIDSWRMFKILGEFVNGFEFIAKYKKAVSIFGSARCGFEHEVYREAEELAAMLAKKGYAVITGGGPGVMEAANKGAALAKGHSVGLNIHLNGNSATEKKNVFVTEGISFDHFFIRKVFLSFASRVYVYFPGGFGTLDEFFELLTLVQTKKIQPIPIILVGKDYWTPLLAWIENTVYKKNKAINEEDMDLYYLVDSAEEAFKIIKKVK